MASWSSGASSSSHGLSFLSCLLYSYPSDFKDDLFCPFSYFVLLRAWLLRIMIAVDLWHYCLFGFCLFVALVLDFMTILKDWNVAISLLW